MKCNIDKTDRINRAAIGALLMLSAIFNFSKTFYLAFGIILILQAIIGWCSIPILVEKLKIFKK
jgi:hypothetical protein